VACNDSATVRLRLLGAYTQAALARDQGARAADKRYQGFPWPGRVKDDDLGKRLTGEEGDGKRLLDEKSMDDCVISGPGDSASIRGFLISGIVYGWSWNACRRRPAEMIRNCSFLKDTRMLCVVQQKSAWHLEKLENGEIVLSKDEIDYAGC